MNPVRTFLLPELEEMVVAALSLGNSLIQRCGLRKFKQKIFLSHLVILNGIDRGGLVRPIRHRTRVVEIQMRTLMPHVVLVVMHIVC